MSAEWRFKIAQYVGPHTSPVKELFFLVELMPTSDGIRSRIAEGTYTTLESAKAAAKERAEKLSKEGL